MVLGWCSKTLSQSPRWGGVPKVGVVLKKVVPKSSMGWSSKSWVGAPKSCSRILDGVVFQKLGWCSKKVFPESPWIDGVVFQKVVPESPLCILLLEKKLYEWFLPYISMTAILNFRLSPVFAKSYITII